MLFECSCEATKNIIDEAYNNSIALRPLNDTPLAALVTSTTVVPIKDLTGKLDENLKAIPDDVLKEQSNNSLHNGFTDEISERAASIINRRIDVIRNTVIPNINAIGETILSTIDESKLNSNTMNVVKYAACDLIFISSFMDDVRKNTPSSYLSPSTYFNEDPLDIAKIFELLNTGSKTFDEALAITLNRLGQDTIFHIWESLFVDSSKSTLPSYSNFDQLVINPEKGLDNAIVIFVLSNALENKNKNAARQYKEAAAYFINLYAKDYNKNIEAGTLIKSIEKDCINVYSINYTTFLQKGGTVEMVIGAASSNGEYFNIDTILENSVELMKSYTLLKSSKELEYRVKVGNIAIKKLRDEFYRSLTHEASDFEKAYFTDNPGTVETISNKFENMVVLLTAESVKDIYRRITEILCLSRFYYLDCYDFMTTMDILHQENYTPEEALTQATLKEICNYVASMITK